MENTAWQISGHLQCKVLYISRWVAMHFWQPKQKRKCEYLHDLMWKEKGQPETLGKAQLSLVLKIKESFLWGITKRTLFNLINAHKSIFAVNTAHNRKASPWNPGTFLLVICNLETGFILSRGTNRENNLQTVLHNTLVSPSQFVMHGAPVTLRTCSLNSRSAALHSGYESMLTGLMLT